MSTPTATRRFRLAVMATIVLTGLGVSAAPQTARPTQKPVVKPTPTPAVVVNPDAPAVAAFMERVNQYVALHKKLEDTLPKLSKEATPEQIDQRERSLATLIQGARPKAQRGDIFTPEMTAIVKRVMVLTFSAPDGEKLRNSIMDENVAELPLKVNQRFPSAIPMATMPPLVLKSLPELPEEMQYRFVASQFVLLDPHANIVVDFIPAVIPVKK